MWHAVNLNFEFYYGVDLRECVKKSWGFEFLQ